MKICFWSTSFQADNQALAYHLAVQPNFEVVAAIDRPAAFRQEAIWRVWPFPGRLLDRQSKKTIKEIEEFAPDVVIVDNHLPKRSLGPRILVLWHGLGWRMDDISGMRDELKKLVGDVTVSNPNFRWQAFGDWDREFTIEHRGIAAENVVALGSAYSDMLVPSSPFRRSFDAGSIVDSYDIDVCNRKVLLFGMTWHHGNLLGHWGDEEELLDRLFSHIRQREAGVIFRLHDRKRYPRKYLATLDRVLDKYDNVHVKFKSESPDSLVDLLVSDVMVSNYSSFANAFYYTGKPCVHIDPVDANATDFVWRRFHRGRVKEEKVDQLEAIWKLSPKEHGGLRASSFDELLAQIDRALDVPSCCAATSREFTDRYVTGVDGETCLRIERFLKSW